MRFVALTVVALCLIWPLQVGAGPDGRSTPPGWSWGSGKMQIEFDINKNSCTNIKVPAGGEVVSSTASGEVCPVNMVSHGYWFGKKATTVTTTPNYTSSGCMTEKDSRGRVVSNTCPADFPNAKVTNTSGTQYPKYKNITSRTTREDTWGGYTYLTMYSYDAFTSWNTKTTYTVDPDKIYMKCCEMKTQ